MLNKQHIPILREARCLIEIGQERMICFAVIAVAGSDQTLANEIINFVEKALGREATLMSWTRFQMRSHHPLPAALHDLTTCGRIDSAVRGQRDLMRMAWLDRMIADIEEAA